MLIRKYVPEMAGHGRETLIPSILRKGWKKSSRWLKTQTTAIKPRPHYLGLTVFVNSFVVFCPFCRAGRPSGTPHDRAASTPTSDNLLSTVARRFIAFL